MIEITENTAISEDELVYSASRSSGPGGQHVNKVSTRVTVSFNVLQSGSLSEKEKQRILGRLGSRINREGIIRVASQKHRSQKANRDAATARLVELLGAALKRKPVRKKTRIPHREKERRLEEKRKRSQVKQHRGKIDTS